MQQSQGQSPSYHTNTNSCFFSSRDCAAKPRAVTLVPHKHKQTVQQSQGQSPLYHTNTNRLCNKAKGSHPHTTQIQTPSYHTNTNNCFFSSTDYAAKPRAVTLIPHKYKQLFLFFYRLCSKAKGSHPHTTQIQTNRLCNKAKGSHPHTTQIQTAVSFLLQTMQQSQGQSPSYHTNIALQSVGVYLLSSHVYRCVCNVASQLLVMSKWI